MAVCLFCSHCKRSQCSILPATIQVIDILSIQSSASNKGPTAVESILLDPTLHNQTPANRPLHHPMSDHDDEFVFDGNLKTLTSGQFVRIVRQDALHNDKGTDDQWIGLYASAHMDGPALQWLEHQPEKTQQSWKLLRGALLLRWPPTTLACTSAAIIA